MSCSNWKDYCQVVKNFANSNYDSIVNWQSDQWAPVHFKLSPPCCSIELCEYSFIHSFGQSTTKSPRTIAVIASSRAWPHSHSFKAADLDFFHFGISKLAIIAPTATKIDSSKCWQVFFVKVKIWWLLTLVVQLVGRFVHSKASFTVV